MAGEGNERTAHESDGEVSATETDFGSPPPRRSNRGRSRRRAKKNVAQGALSGLTGAGGLGNQLSQTTGAVTDTVGGLGGAATNAIGGVAGNAVAQQGGGGKRSDTLRLRLDLNIDIHVELHAKIHGDLELSLL